MTAVAFHFADSTTDDPELRGSISVAVHIANSVQLGESKRYAEALREIDAALHCCRTCGQAWFYRGQFLEKLGDLVLAYEAFAQACILTPMYREPRSGLAEVGARLSMPTEILTQWKEHPKPSLRVRASTFIRRALRLRERVDFDPQREQESVLRANVARCPDSGAAHAQLARRLIRQGRYVEAECFLRYGLALDPACGLAAFLLATLVEERSGSLEAKQIATDALAAGATDERLPGIAFWSALKTCDWADLERWRKQTLAAFKRETLSISSLQAIYLADDPLLQQTAAAATNRRLSGNSTVLGFTFPRRPKRFLTLGYLSADFRDHAVGRLLPELFERHDRSAFRVVGLSLFADEKSAVAERIRKSLDRIEHIGGLPSKLAAERIYAAGVDILIDLTGHTLFAPAAILARRPAPVQVNYLGYPGTLGTPDLDYILVDHTVVPRDQARFFNEALVYLPGCYMVSDRNRAVVSASCRATFGLPAAAVVYCDFNEARKITPEAFDVWMRILQRVPGSVLMLSAANDHVARNLRSEAVRRGVEPARLIFSPRLPAADYFARYSHCDLFLDTIGYSGHATANDAIWAGCPIVTLMGATYPARVAASIVRAAGFPELVTRTVKEYEEVAVRVGHDPDFRSRLKQRALAARSSELFDTPLFKLQLEWAFQHMWELHLQGLEPRSFEVPSFSMQDN